MYGDFMRKSDEIKRCCVDSWSRTLVQQHIIAARSPAPSSLSEKLHSESAGAGPDAVLEKLDNSAEVVSRSKGNDLLQSTKHADTHPEVDI